MQTAPSAQPTHSQASGGHNWTATIVLVICAIGFAFAFHALLPEDVLEGGAPQGVRSGASDSDGDGIPDSEDRCFRRGWRSGPVTDFDGDGCQDDVEDFDKDNDGISDSADSCPFTPISFGFTSNIMTDFDADGCADMLEDLDNDNDGVPNSADRCPRTPLTEQTVEGGCFLSQVVTPHQQSDPSWWELLACPHPIQPIIAELNDGLQCKTCWEGIGELKAAWKSIVASAIVAFVLQQFQTAGAVILGKISELPVESLHRHASSTMERPSSVDFTMHDGAPVVALPAGLPDLTTPRW